MHRSEAQWYSTRIGIDMPIAAYGHAGPALLMLPTATADYLEYERYHLIQDLGHHIDNGRLRIYSINNITKWALFDHGMPGWQRTALLAAYDDYIVSEVLPWIRINSGDPWIQPVIAGISIGAYSAANTFFKHPDVLRGLIAISGTYDIAYYLDGYFDDNLYFNNPGSYLPNLHDDWHLSRMRQDAIILSSGQGAYEEPGHTIHLSNMLNDKGVNHWLDLWGYDVAHDWPWWPKMLDHYVHKLYEARVW